MNDCKAGFLKKLGEVLPAQLHPLLIPSGYSDYLWCLFWGMVFVTVFHIEWELSGLKSDFDSLLAVTSPATHLHVLFGFGYRQMSFLSLGMLSPGTSSTSLATTFDPFYSAWSALEL